MSRAHGYADAANGKRKRDERDDRKLAPKERRLKQRQEEMEEEFAATYHGPTSLYKLLEIKHMRCPLFLPRTLSYRLTPPHAGAANSKTEELKSDTDANKKKAPSSSAVIKKSAFEATSATLREFKIGMTAETIEYFKREGMRVGLLFSMYTATGHKFADNSFELVATCLIPVPCNKEARLPKEFVRPKADIVVVLVQVVKVTDVIDKLMAETQYVFTIPAASAGADAKPVLGAELLRARVTTRDPLFSSMLRMDGSRRRTGVFTVELSSVAAHVRGVVKLQFRMAWDKPTKQSGIARLESVVASKWALDYINTKDDISDLLTIPARTKASPWTRRGRAGDVYYHYLYHSMLRRITEKRPDYSCAWCNLYAGSLQGLVCHLTSSHSRFRFQVMTGPDTVPHIYVMPRNLMAGSSVPNVNSALCELNLDDEKESDRIEHHFTFVSARKRAGRAAANAAEDAALDRFHELSAVEPDADKKHEFYAPLLHRQYFHSRTGAVVLDHEKNYDSDDDVDEEWITQQSERLLDEFEDVSLEEKEFMKKWNRHVKENRILADFMVASSCRLFAKQHGKWLIETGLRYNFLLHLFNLWDNSLLNSRAIIDCILIVDHYAVLEEAKANDAEAKPANGATPAKPTTA